MKIYGRQLNTRVANHAQCIMHPLIVALEGQVKKIARQYKIRGQQMNLSPAMMSTLVDMLEIQFCVDYKDRSLCALERRGLAKWYPYAKPESWVRDGCWKLTQQGRKIATEIAQLQSGA